MPRRLSAVPDRFTVGPVARDITWELGEDPGAGPGVLAAPHATFRQEETHER